MLSGTDAKASEQARTYKVKHPSYWQRGVSVVQTGTPSSPKSQMNRVAFHPDVRKSVEPGRNDAVQPRAARFRAALTGSSRMKHLFCIAALLGSASLTACAQAPQPGPAAASPTATAAPAKPGTADARVRAGLEKLNPNIKVDYIGAAPLPGFREVIVGGQVIYVSDDGKYLVQGTVVDIETKSELTGSSSALSAYRKGLLQSAPVSDRIVFAPANPVYTVSIFTDIECGYCRKLHNEIVELNKLGIAVEYLAFPRMGLGSKDHKDMVSVWCAVDRNQALTAAKSDRPIAAKDCKNPVASQYELGQRLGVTGTPAVYAPDGTQLGGYLPPQQMRAALDALAGKTKGQPSGML
jgi:thiol:disulfide interchange protein DsbC